MERGQPSAIYFPPHFRPMRALLLGLVFTALSLALHLAPVWVTMLNRGAFTWDGQPLPHDHIEEVISLHRTGDNAFARRPLTTMAIDAFVALGASPKLAFIAIGLAGFLIAGLLVYRAAVLLGASSQHALWAQAFFHASPTVLCAWFDPLYTYDEPLQYAALLAALVALLSGHWLGLAIAFGTACIARESSVLLAPAFLFIGGGRKAVLPLLVGVGLFGGWLALASGADARTLEEDALRRLACFGINFSIARVGETIAYLLLVLALPVFLLFRTRALSASWSRAFFITLLINTSVVLTLALAREARLLALPMILAWPFMGRALHLELATHSGWNGLLAPLRRPAFAIGFVLTTGFLAATVYTCFQSSSGVQGDTPFHELLIAQFAFLLLCKLSVAARYRPSTANP